MADVKTISGVFRSLCWTSFTKEPVPVWIGIMSWDTEQSCYGSSLWRRKRLCFANFFKDKMECRK
jgi:hypothetical protein